MSVIFSESESWNYQDRTRHNAASADVTIAFARDFDTAGEKLTRKAVYESGRIYVPVTLPEGVHTLRSWEFACESARRIASSIEAVFGGNEIDPLRLNIAGNSITSLPGRFSQEDVDVYVTRTLMVLGTYLPISHVRSGGQTGLDEAGVKAADVLGIPAEVHAPKGWRMRVRGTYGRYEDVSGETLFKRRFAETEHLEHLGEISRQVYGLDISPEEKRSLFEGETVSLECVRYDDEGVSRPILGTLEIAGSSAGVDRLWVNDDTFADHLAELRERKEEVKDEALVYYIYEAMPSDAEDPIMVMASSLEEAERLLDSKYGTDFDYLMAVSVVVDGRGYDLGKHDRFSDLMSGRPEVLLAGEKPDFINVWHSSGENAGLSNFAVRPFSISLPDGSTGDFMSVEQAFQYAKTLPCYSNMLPAVRDSVQKKILSTTDGAVLKHLGRGVHGLNLHYWNRDKELLMRGFVMKSFVSNPEELKRLVATDGIRIVHLQDHTSWGKVFPEILEDVRDSILQKVSKRRMKTAERRPSEIQSSLLKKNNAKKLR